LYAEAAAAQTGTWVPLLNPRQLTDAICQNFPLWKYEILVNYAHGALDIGQAEEIN
jgi:hypothetical protein